MLDCRTAMSTNATFWLRPAPPFRLDLTVWALRRVPHNVIDRWDGEVYRRALAFDNGTVSVAIAQSGSSDSPRLRVTVIGSRLGSGTKPVVTQCLERLLGPRINLAAFYRRAQADPRLSALARKFRGLKPPRFPTLFETLANAIACQQMSLSVGILLLNRLTQKFGPAAEIDSGTIHAFPGPAEVANLRVAALRSLGFSRQKASSLIALARACMEDQIDSETLRELSNDAVVEKLTKLKGIGRWSAEYALLRGLGRLTVYPGDDVGARNNLRRWLRLKRPLDYHSVHQITSRWHPYAGLVYFYMLLARLDAAGSLA